MKTEYLTITPRDPLIARDGRPFGAGASNRMRSLDWFYPSVSAGALRTMLGKTLGGFTTEVVDKIKAVAVHGPLPFRDGKLYVQKPSDFAADAAGKCYCARPAVYAEGEGTDLPAGLIPAQIEDTFKPASVPELWSMEKIARWLSAKAVPDGFSPKDGAMPYPSKETRVHLEMNNDTGAGMDGMLFETKALDFTVEGELAPLGMAVKAIGGEIIPEGVDTMGGERRMVEWRKIEGAAAWKCPQSVEKALSSADCKRVRLCLATPAIFSEGWRPAWIKEDLEGKLPGTELKLKLVAASVPRWQPISGWSLVKPVGPKPVRRMAPAGSVYFFEVESGKATELVGKWLEPVSDDAQDILDGFGLALWGIW